jgi:hypothetical protein
MISEFTFEGGFNAFFSKLCDKRQKEDVSFVLNRIECCCYSIFKLLTSSSFSLSLLANLWNEEQRVPPIGSGRGEDQARNF